MHHNTLQLTASHYTTLQHTAMGYSQITHCNTTYCNKLHHTATHCDRRLWCQALQRLQLTATLYPHHTATHCNTLQHTATGGPGITHWRLPRTVFTRVVYRCFDLICGHTATEAHLSGVLQCVAVCCSVLQRVAALRVCVPLLLSGVWAHCTFRRCVAPCCVFAGALQQRRPCEASCNMLHHVVACSCCSMLQRIAACCSVLQRVAACCGVLCSRGCSATEAHL